MTEFFLAKSWWQFLVLAILCYGVGCFNFAVFISRRKHNDITKMGSGNPGTMNMSREFGLKIGLLTFFCDALKGGLPALCGFLLYKGYVFSGTAFRVADFARYWCGFFVVIGHIFPVTMRFKGGKGIASTLGLFGVSLTCERLWLFVIVCCVLTSVVLFIYFTEWGSLGSLLGVSTFSIIQLSILLVRYQNFAVNAYLVASFLIIFAINLCTWCAHHKNLARLFSGEEHRTSIKKLANHKKNSPKT